MRITQLLEIGRIGMLFESSAFFPILGVHLLAGLVCTGIRIFETSTKTGAGMEEWLAYLKEARVVIGA